VTVIENTMSTNPYLLTEEQEAEQAKLHTEYRTALTIPRRPHWDATTTPEQLNTRESISFLDWRRGLVELEEEKGLLMTPYERNLEVWKQLWRVIERSELVVQIVDGRNPLLFRCPDVDTYVKEVSNDKKCLLLVNKADLLTTRQRLEWAAYFTKMDIPFIFFSAAMAKQKLEEDEFMEKRLPQEGDLEMQGSDEEAESSEDEQEFKETDVPGLLETSFDDQSAIPEEARIVGALDLLDKLKLACPSSAQSLKSGKNTIGFVGYPNVGKSSTMNALVGAKKCSVGSTPGKTKHFQTIHISDTMILCDCPGLVFPSFASTKVPSFNQRQTW
jgi:large subunit GTPase 1